MFIVALSTFASSTSERHPNLKAADAGNWTVGDCILAQFAIEVTVHYNTKDFNETMIVDVPPNATVAAGSQCGQAKQSLTLVWSDLAFNDSSVTLNRSLTIDFAVMPNDTFYGVRQLSATFDLATWNEEVDNVTVSKKSFVKIDSGDDPKLMFHTPLDRSYLCANIRNMDLDTSLFLDESAGIQLANSTLVAKKVQFDAFRTKDRAPPGFRTPLDCDYRPNDIVPIAVGVALALLVVTVLISYLVGRRRYQRGYQSV